jgi:hypothetical protein
MSPFLRIEAMPTPQPHDKQPATNAHGVQLPVRAKKVTGDSVDRRAQAERLKAEHSVAFKELAKR